jgi:acyl-CoA synthetase (AMP-forming)/AMP-acid ligase II
MIRPVARPSLFSHWKRTGKAALVAADARLDYPALDERISRLAAGLIERGGVRRGVVVAVLLPNSVEFVVAYYAIGRAGGIVQPIDERLLAGEVEAMLSDSGAEGLIVHGTLASRIGRLHDEPGALRWMLGVSLGGPGLESWEDWCATAPRDLAGPSLEDIAELMYTSGTAGEPKGVMRSHGNVLAASHNSITGLGHRTDDTILIMMPLSHSSALNSQMVPILQIGGTVVLLERFSVRGALETIRAEKVTCMRAVPSMLRALLTAPEFRDEALPSLRRIINSSATIDRDTFVELKRRFASIEIMNSYGLTEASTCTVLPDGEVLRRPESIGVPIEGVGMTLRDPNGGEVAEGGEGEIWVRGDHVFAAYRGRPGLREQTVRDGWLRTGDLAHADADGYYYLHGRQDDMIDCGGRKFAPLEVEQTILEVDGVAEAAVVGMPHRMLGQVAKAFVVPRDGATVEPRAVIRHCQSRLASYKVPFAVDLIGALPRNSLGKLVRRRLTEAT